MHHLLVRSIWLDVLVGCGVCEGRPSAGMFLGSKPLGQDACSHQRPIGFCSNKNISMRCSDVEKESEAHWVISSEANLCIYSAHHEDK